MTFLYHSRLPRSSRARLAALALLGAVAGRAQAQDYNGGTLYNTGSVYHGRASTNAGTVTSTGPTAIVYYGGAGPAFTNSGPYSAASGATDQFVGPDGAAGTQELAGSTAPTFFHLTLANGSASVFNLTNVAGALVNGTLTLSNGKTTTLATLAGALRLGSSAAVGGTLGAANAYVDGYVGRASTGAGTFLYPLGASNQNASATGNPNNGAIIYSPATLSNPTGTTLRYLAAPAPNNKSLTPGDAVPLTNVSAKEYYDMPQGGAPAGSTVMIPYDNFGPLGYVGSTGTLTIAAYNSGTSKWENLSSSASNTIASGTSPKTVQVTLNKTLTTGTYTLLALASTTSTNPLPVQLTAFTATRQGTDGLLRWTTATELNSAYFEVQASADGSKWQVLSKVAAAGSSSTPRDYAFTDREIARYGVPVVYYRLNQVDQDGTSAFSPVRTLAPAALAWSAGAYPNPFAGTLSAQLTTSETSPVTVTMLDALGRVVLRREASPTPGTQLLDLDEARAVAPGTYVLLVRQGTHTATLHVSKN